MAYAANIDTLQISKRFEKAGIEKEAAEEIAQVFNEVQSKSNEDAATKHDIELVRSEIALVLGKIELSQKDIIIKLSALIIITGMALGGFLAWFLRLVINH